MNQTSGGEVKMEIPEKPEWWGSKVIQTTHSEGDVWHMVYSQPNDYYICDDKMEWNQADFDDMSVTVILDKNGK